MANRARQIEEFNGEGEPLQQLGAFYKKRRLAYKKAKAEI